MGNAVAGEVEADDLPRVADAEHDCFSGARVVDRGERAVFVTVAIKNSVWRQIAPNHFSLVIEPVRIRRKRAGVIDSSEIARVIHEAMSGKTGIEVEADDFLVIVDSQGVSPHAAGNVELRDGAGIIDEAVLPGILIVSNAYFCCA